MTMTPGEPSVSEGQTSTRPAASSPQPAAVGEPSDAAIVDALSRGEPRAALARCAERHGASIGRLCMAMLGSQVDADDVTRETLLSVHQRFAECPGARSVRAWLFGIARAQCLQRLEKGRRRGPKPAPVMGGDSALGDLELGVQRRAAKARVLLEQVRPSDRDALLLRFAADLSFEEVAAACGVDERTARRRASRALLRLRSVLESEYDDG